MQLRSGETRERIAQTAMRLFAQKGFDATGVAEICEASEVSKGAFYHHFSTKQALFAELLQGWLAGLDAALGLKMRDAATVPEALLAMASEIREVFTAADGTLGIFVEFWKQARAFPDVWEYFTAPFTRYRDYFAGIMRKGIAEGSIGQVDPESAAQVLVSLAVGIVVQGVLDPKAARWDDVTRESVQILLDGLLARNGNGGRI